MADSEQPTRRLALMTTDTIGGVWTYAIDLARALAPHGYEFAIATMGRRMSADQRAQAQACGNVRVFESDFRLEWMENPWDDVARAGDWLLRLAADLRPDLIHLNGYVHATLPWGAPVTVIAHSCVLSWWQAVKRERAPASYDRYCLAVREGLHAADIVVAPTHGMMASIENLYGRLRNRRVIPNGRDALGYRAGPKKEFILTAGRLWDEAKNIAVLATVAPELAWPVLVAGDDTHPDGAETPLRNVRPLGRLSSHDLAGWYARASVYALPARYEPFGLSVLEAALSGCALVLGDIPTLRENWDGAALFVDPGDSRALRAALRMLIESPAMRAALGDRALERAERFTPERMARGWADVYAELISVRKMHSCA